MPDDVMQFQNLVWSIVNKLLTNIPDKSYKSELEYELFQEGFLGLMEAKQRFDEEQNIKFTTFAYPYIKGYCLKYLNKEIRVSSNTQEFVLNENDAYEEDFSLTNLDIISTIKDVLRKTNRKLSDLEENILFDRIENNLDYRTIANKNNCSSKKVYNVIYKYKALIKKIIENNF